MVRVRSCHRPSTGATLGDIVETLGLMAALFYMLTASAAEQQPKDWLNAFTSVTLGLAQAVAVERWQAVGLSAMLPTLVLTDGVGAAATPGGIDAHFLEPLGPAITWEDGRAEAEGSALREGFGGDALYRRTGQWVDGRYLLPMALRLAAREPERVGAARYLLEEIPSQHCASVG